MIIRVAALTDAEPVATLVTALGYPTTPEQARSRLAGMARNRATLAVVGELEEQVVGLATAHAVNAVHDDRLIVYLTALVVATAARKRAVGRGLVTQVEEWARFQGAARLSLVTGLERADSQGFYERLGYARTGVRYAKAL